MLKPHAISQHFPLLEGAEYEAFREDIQRRGLLEPIWLYEGKILDGRNRYRACTDLGIELRTREYTGASPVSFSWSMNGVRRSLTHAQKVLIALEMLPELEAEAAKRVERHYAAQRRDEHGQFVPSPAPIEPREPGSGEAAAAAARLVGVSATSIYQAKALRQQNPAQFERVKSGEVAIGTAFKTRIVVKPTQADTIASIRTLSADGYVPQQIAAQLKISVGHVRDLARENNITLADAGFRHSARLSPARVLEQTVSSIEGCALGVQTIEGQLEKVLPEKAREWAQALQAPLKTLVALRGKLLKIAESKS